MPWLFILLGYVIGATPFGYLAGRLKGIDIRQHGSGNIGATNVLRVLGKPIGMTVFALDALKGAVPVLLAVVFADHVEPVHLIPVLTAVATILGHNYTFWLKFKGGKGIATSAGALIPLLPWTILIAVAVWLVLFYATRFVSVASIGAALTLPAVQIAGGFMEGDWRERLPHLIVAALIGGLAIYRHKTNIRKLLAGTEPRFTPKRDRPAGG